MPHLKTILAATRDALALLGLAALSGFYAQERSFLWLLPATLLVCGVWYCVFKIHKFLGRAGVGQTERGLGQGTVSLPHPKIRPHFRTMVPESNAGKSGRENFPLTARPPRSARYVYTLTEGEIPVQVEYDRRAVDNWLALGDDHDAIPHSLPRAPLTGSHGRLQHELARPA